MSSKLTPRASSKSSYCLMKSLLSFQFSAGSGVQGLELPQAVFVTISKKVETKLNIENSAKYEFV